MEETLLPLVSGTGAALSWRAPGLRRTCDDGADRPPERPINFDNHRTIRPRQPTISGASGGYTLRGQTGYAHAPLHTAHLPSAPAREHAGGVVHLGTERSSFSTRGSPTWRRSRQTRSSRPGWCSSRCRRIVADTVGRRASYLLGTLTLTASTLLYVMLWQVEAPFWQWGPSPAARPRIHVLLRAVEAWLVDALAATGYGGDMETVFGRGRWSRERQCSAARSREASSPSRPVLACRSCSAA